MTAKKRRYPSRKGLCWIYCDARIEDVVIGLGGVRLTDNRQHTFPMYVGPLRAEFALGTKASRYEPHAASIFWDTGFLPKDYRDRPWVAVLRDRKKSLNK